MVGLPEMRELEGMVEICKDMKSISGMSCCTACMGV